MSKNNITERNIKSLAFISELTHVSHLPSKRTGSSSNDNGQQTEFTAQKGRRSNYWVPILIMQMQRDSPDSLFEIITIVAEVHKVTVVVISSRRAVTIASRLDTDMKINRGWIARTGLYSVISMTEIPRFIDE